MTAARRAVITALLEARGHPTAEQLAATVPDTDLSSVYRTLELLVDLRVVQHVQTPRGPAAYHLLDGRPAHAHAQCHECGAILDLPGDPLARVSDELEQSLRFSVWSSAVTLLGRCAGCRARRDQ